MTSAELENLARIGALKREPSSLPELEGRFDLAYNAAHALALVALRRAGFRSDKRYVVFQTLAHTLSIPATTCRMLAKCHEIRNAGEYEGVFDIDEGLVEEHLTAATAVRDALRQT